MKSTFALPLQRVLTGDGPVQLLPSAITSAREQKQRDVFYKGCIESLLMDRKDRLTVSGQHKLSESLNKLLLNHTDIIKMLLMKRVNEVSTRMFITTLKPGM